MSIATELICFLLWELSLSFCIFHRHRVCLVDRGDLICSLYKYWEGFRSSSLAPLPLGFNCGFIPILHVGHPQKFAPEAALEDLCLTSEERLWRQHSCLNFSGPASVRYAGDLVATEAGDVVFLGFFLAFGSSAPVGIEHGSGTAAWTAGTRRYQVCRDDGGLRYRSYGTFSVVF